MITRLCIFFALAIAGFAFAGCAPEPGSERWCDNKADATAEERAEWKPAEWNEYAELCFEDGSKGWCAVQREAPKDDWGLKEIGHFAMNCMLNLEEDAEDEDTSAN